VAPTGRKRLRAIDYEGVTLGPGRLRDQFEQACSTFADLPNDALLRRHRQRAGLPAPGASLGGWYGLGLFNNLGQFMTLYARLHAATADRHWADKATALLHGWIETIDDDGWFLDTEQPLFSKEYSYDKLVCGLLDVHQYVGAPEALPALRRITEWMTEHAYRGKGFANGLESLEWYTLTEYLLRAHAVTGDAIYRELAEAFVYDEYYEAVLERDAGALLAKAEAVHGVLQAHSHLNALNGAAALYEHDGDPRHLEVARAGYDLLQASQVYATGMFGPMESFMKPRQRGEALHSESGHAEISCPSWAMDRFVRHLVELTGEAAFGDWMELNVYNGIGAAPPTRADGRAVQYFADYGFDGARKTWGIVWSCCSTTNPISIVEHHNQLYYLGPSALHVCLYVPSTITCRLDDATLTLTQHTAFPAEERVTFDVGLDRELGCTIAFRLPGWLAGPARLTIDGTAVDIVARDGWAVLERIWRDGEVVTLDLPMAVTVLPVEPGLDDGPVALRYGPVVLVVPETGNPRRLGIADAHAMARTLHRDDGADLGFSAEAADGTPVSLRPYYAMAIDEPYAMHFDDDGRRVGHGELVYESADAWRLVEVDTLFEGSPVEMSLTRTRRYRVASTAGASFSTDFEGTGILWAGYRSQAAGWADVHLDGALVDRVTQLGHGEMPPSLWGRDDLAPGRHELRIVVTGEAPSGSLGTDVNVTHLRVLTSED
jgi:hypothetical protein